MRRVSAEPISGEKYTIGRQQIQPAMIAPQWSNSFGFGAGLALVLYPLSSWVLPLPRGLSAGIVFGAAAVAAAISAAFRNVDGYNFDLLGISVWESDF